MVFHLTLHKTSQNLIWWLNWLNQQNSKRKNTSIVQYKSECMKQKTGPQWHKWTVKRTDTPGLPVWVITHVFCWLTGISILDGMMTILIWNILDKHHWEVLFPFSEIEFLVLRSKHMPISSGWYHVHREIRIVHAWLTSSNCIKSP